MLRKWVWRSSYLAITNLSSEPFSNYDFIYLRKGSFDSWGGNGLALNRYQREKSRTVLALQKRQQRPSKGVQRSSKIRD